MVRKAFCLGTVLAAGMLIASCTHESPVQLSADGTEDRTNARLIQSGPDEPFWYGTPWHNVPITMIAKTDGNVEILRRTLDNKIKHFRWKEPATSWTSMGTFGTNVLSDAALCLNPTTGNLQAVIRTNNGKPYSLAHWERVNGVWAQKTVFGDNCIGSPTMLYNNNPNARYLEVVSWIVGNKLAHYTKKSVWGTTPVIITPPSDHIIVQDPVIAQDGSGNMFLAVVVMNAVDMQVKLLVYYKGTPNGTWTSVSMSKVDVADLSRWVKPSICSYGTKGWISILAGRQESCAFKEYRLKYGASFVTGGEDYSYQPHVAIAQICHAAKDSKYIYMVDAQIINPEFTSTAVPWMHKIGYVDGE